MKIGDLRNKSYTKHLRYNISIQRPTHNLDTSAKTDRHQNLIQSDEGAKKLALHTALLNHAMLIGDDLAPQEEASLLDCLHRN